MAVNTLADVGEKALEDPAFWQKLRANPAAAVREAGFSLQPEDMNALEEAVSRNRVAIELDQLMDIFHENLGTTVNRWPRGWAGRWPRDPLR